MIHKLWISVLVIGTIFYLVTLTLAIYLTLFICVRKLKVNLMLVLCLLQIGNCVSAITGLFVFWYETELPQIKPK